MKKNENVHAIISVTALQNYIFFFEIRDQEVVYGLVIELTLKFETKVAQERGVGRLCLVKIIKVS